MSLKCIIVEDMEEDMEVLRDFIEREEALTLTAEFNNVLEAKAYLLTNEVDLIFSDIMIGENDGLAFIRSLENRPQVIFTTSFPNFAVTGFELNATDYLVKPFSYFRFSEAVGKAVSRNSNQAAKEDAKPMELSAKHDHFFIRSKYNIIRINYDDLIYVEGMKSYVTFYTADQSYTSAIHLKIVEEQLPNTIFIRIHRSFIVNINKIELLNNNEVIVKGKTLPLGENYKEEFLSCVVGKKIMTKQQEE